MKHQEAYYKAVAKLFDYFYNKLYRQASYKLDINQGYQKKMIDSFIILIGTQFQLPGVGVNYLIEYFCFSFHYWFNKSTSRKITLGWIIGQKTFKRWLDRSEGVDYYTAKFLKEHSIDIALVKQQLFELEDKRGQLDPSEELEKLRFDGEARLYHCFQHTTLYNHKSLNCIRCLQKTACKKLLKTTAPLIYKERGYLTETA